MYLNAIALTILLNIVYLVDHITSLEQKQGTSYYSNSAYCPHSCRCKANRDQNSRSYYHDMYVQHWLQKVYGYGDQSSTKSSKDKPTKGHGQGQGREMMCLGLQELPLSLPSDLVKLRIFGGKQGLRRLREGALYSDAPYEGMDNKLPVHYYQITKFDRNVFERANSITELEVTGNRIKILSNELEPLKKLKTISLRRNRIKILEPHSFDRLYELEKVDLTNNHIMKIPVQVFRGAYKLRELRLGKNKIGLRGLHRDTFASLSELRVLDLSENLLTALHPDIFKRNSLLEELNLSENNLTEIDVAWFQGMLKLKKLNLMGNGFIRIPDNAFRPLLMLSELNLAGNRLQTIERDLFIKMPKLEKLDLSNNRLTTVKSYTFADLFHLKELHLQENLIKTLENATFSSLKLLLKLSLANNQLKEIPHLMYEPLRSLKKLDLSFNFIKSLKARAFFGLHNVREISMEHNEISELDDNALSVSWMRHYSKITWLSLQNNKIPYISGALFRVAPHIKYLDLGHNHITDLGPDAFKTLVALSILKLQDNEIAELSDYVFKHLKSLQILDLSQNKLLYVPSRIFAGLIRVEEISLASNRLMSIPEAVFNNTPRLVHADISGNHLDRIPMRMFRNTKYLRRLNMENSSITALDVAINLGYKLDHFNLADNHLESLGPAIITWLARNSTFKLGGNPWTCDCRLAWVTDAIQTGFVYVPDRDFVTCKRPLYLIGEKISTMIRSQFTCNGKKFLKPAPEVVYRQEPTSSQIYGTNALSSRFYCPLKDKSNKRRLPRPILEEWHATIFDRYKRPICDGVRISPDFILTHAICWLNRSISDLDLMDGRVLIKTGSERNIKRQYSFRAAKVYIYPKMHISSRTEYKSIALVKIDSLKPFSRSQYYPCITNPRNTQPKHPTYFLTAKLAAVRPKTRIKLRTMTVRGHRRGICDGIRFACTKSFVRRLPSSKYLTDSAPLYAREDFGLVGIRSMRQSIHLQTFIGIAELVPWIEHVISSGG